MLLPRLATLSLVAAGLAAAAWTALAPDDAGLPAVVALALAATAYAWLESGPGSAAELALIGSLAGSPPPPAACCSPRCPVCNP